MRSRCSLSLFVLLLAIGTAHAQIQILHSFGATFDDGYLPESDLQLVNGTLYGTTRWGGAVGDNPGTIFRMELDGSNYSVIHQFAADGSEGKEPRGNVAVIGSMIYGSTHLGGDHDRGTLFQIGTDGSGFATLHQFDSTNVYQSGFNGVIARSGTLYGMMPIGGAHNDGLVYSFDTGGAGFATLHSFNIVVDGYGPQGDLVLVNSHLYGMSTFAGGALFQCDQDGSNYTILHRFGIGNDGALPYGSLAASAGGLYGMTEVGGAFNDGTVFSLNVDGSNYQILHSFSNGELPLGDVIVDGSTIYGLTRFGGSFGLGSLFRMETNGSNFQVLHSFSGSPADGQHPHGGLTLLGSTLYGTTAAGGQTGHGTVFSFVIPAPGSLAVAGAGLMACGRRRRVL